MASFSVRDIGGITLRNVRNAGAETMDLRIGAKLNGNSMIASGSSSQIFHTRPRRAPRSVRAKSRC